MQPDWLAKGIADGSIKEGPTAKIPGVDNPKNPGLISGGPTLLEVLVADGVKVSEKQFQQAVISLAQRNGWRVAHFEKVPIAHGKRTTWATPVKADGAGFPDLELVRDRLVKAELKVGKNTTSPEQDAWLCAYRAIGVECYVWYPKDWDAIREALERKAVV